MFGPFSEIFFMSVIVACRSCGRKLRVTDDLLGRKVQCPSCGEAFHAEDLPPEPSLDGNGFRADRENGTPLAQGPRLEMDNEPGMEEDDDRPWERPAAAAGPPRLRTGARRGRADPGHRQSVLAGGRHFLGLAAWIMGAKDLKKMRKGQMDPQGQGTTQAGLICGIVGMVLNVLLTLSCALPMAFGILAGMSAVRMPPPPARTMRIVPAPVAPVPVNPRPPVPVNPRPDE